MRKVWLILVSLLVIVAGFAAYLLLQKNPTLPPSRGNPSVAARPAEDAPQIGSMRVGEGAWVLNFDKSGVQKSRFRARQYLPQKDGRVNVDRPMADFFVGPQRLQVLHVEGKTGVIVTTGEGPRVRSDLSSTAMQPPTRGEMREVTIWYYTSQEAMKAQQAEMVITMNNAYFDNETSEITTEDYVDTAGKTVLGRDVPIHIRGNAFDFDGYGLQVRWDDSSQSMQYLKIFRGEQLTLKKSLASLKGSGKRASGLPVAGVLLASTDAKAGLAEAARANKTGIYRATFHDHVTVTQSAEQLASAKDMLVDFISPEAADEQLATRPSKSSPGAADGQTPAGAGAQKPSDNAAPLTPREGEPIVVKWTGELVVTPAPDDEIKPYAADDAVVRFVGAPAVLNAKGRRIEAAKVAYQTQQQVAVVYGSSGHPAILTDGRGSRLETSALRYWQKDGKVEMFGPSSAQFANTYKGEKQTLSASWNKRGLAQFSGEADAATLSHLELEGDVWVKHPQIQRFNAGFLALEMQTGTSGDKGSSQVQQITAKRNVDCVLLDKSGKTRGIQCDDLKLVFTPGQDTPSQIAARGNVVAGDDLERIKADDLQATLKPKTLPDEHIGELAGLDDLLATGHVEIRGKKGELIKGDRVTVKQQGDKSHWVVAEGSQDSPAVVSRNDSLLAGRHIEASTDGETGLVTGGGKLVLPDASVSGGGAGLPVLVTWSGDARVEGSKDLITIQGNVWMKYTSSDGAVNEAWGDHVDINMGHLSSTGAATTRPKAETRQVAFLANRYAKNLVLTPAAGKEMQVQSLLLAPDGSVLRQINILGPRLECTMSPDGLQQIVVPAAKNQPGRMLYVALPPDTKAPAKVNDPLQGGGLKGSTGFIWHDRLLYDRASNKFAMTGEVMIRHEPQAARALPFEVLASSVVGDLTASTAGRSNRKNSPVEALELKQLTLTGQPVIITRPDMRILSSVVEMYPATSLVVAKGTDRNPVQFEKQNNSGTAIELYFNTQTSDFKVIGATSVGRQ